MSQHNGRWRRMRHSVVVASIPLAAAALMASPAQAEPAPTAPPAGGATPVLSDLLILPQPASSTAAATDAISPLAGQIINAQNTAEHLGEQVKAIADQLATAQAVTAPLRSQWETANAELTGLRDELAARLAVPSPGPSPAPSASPAPVGQSASPDPSAPAAGPASPASQTADPAPSGGPGGPSAASASALVDVDTLVDQIATAQRAEADAKAALDAATQVESEISGRQAVLNEQFQRAQAALSVLTARNSDQIAALESARDRLESSQAASREVSTAVNGLVAGAAAQKAVAFAVSQIGKPYEWAAEGPGSYDCSGLTFASYLSAGIRLPRVAVDQYLHGRGVYVPVNQLLPGDLLFFSTDPKDASKIHHVAIYLGGGRMLHAPTFGEHVKEAPVWWTEYYGALRVVPAVAASGATTTPSSPGQTAPAPAATTPTQPTPSETGSPSTAPATGAPTPTPAPTGTPVPTPTPEPTTPVPTTTATTPVPTTTATTPASVPTTTSTSPASSPSASTTPSPTNGPSPSPSPTPTPSPTGALVAILAAGALARLGPDREQED